MTNMIPKTILNVSLSPLKTKPEIVVKARVIELVKGPAIEISKKYYYDNEFYEVTSIF